MTNKWPVFVTSDLGDSAEDDAEMMRRWEAYDRDMKALIAKGGVHQDADGWWVHTATGELIGPDPEIERPMTDDQAAQRMTFDEAVRRTRGPGKKPAKEVVTIRLDPDVIEAFKADGPGWQSRVNEALRKAKKLPDRAA